MSGSNMAAASCKTRLTKACSAAMLMALLMDPFPKVAAQEGIFRWRVNRTEKQSVLVQAASDATDDFGRVVLSCELTSGNVEVSVMMEDDQRAKFAELLKSERYPTVTLSNGGENNRSVIDKLVFSDVGGWSYAFHVQDDDEWLADFEKTGTLRFTVGDTINDSDSLNVGLDAIAAFRDQCRKPPQALPPSNHSGGSLPWTKPNPNAFPPPPVPSGQRGQ
ncbi:hypothetical protein AAFG07_15890 [Bradyrhizobium sp. B097]|uniref:hypothetical protein n=1 Tax=Bradyrhizobium sp. B097 TaxID=3140244 RepID=UPI0031845BA9